MLETSRPPVPGHVIRDNGARRRRPRRGAGPLGESRVKDYRSYSFWLEQAGDDLTPRPPLDGSISVDIGILGAGFTGLWTAYYLLRRDPSLTIAIVEAEIAGFGASGRNGGWCFSGFPVGPLDLLKKYGRETARDVSLAMYQSVDEVGRVCQDEGIDAHYAKGGALEIARADHDLPMLQRMYDEYAALGLESHYELLDAAGTAEHVRVAGAVGGFWNKEGAVIQPARLARGLARAVERRGATIYERSRVTDFTTGYAPLLRTERGMVRAKVIVLAGEAYMAQLPKVGNLILPLTSHMVVTEPLSAGQWEQIGWRRREVLGGFGRFNGYINHTADGRIAFGAYRARYPFNSNTTDDLDREASIFAHARTSALTWWPELRGIRFTHEWGGVFGVSRDHMPVMRYDKAHGVATGRGYSGKGVAAANLAGRVLADLITGADTSLVRLPMTSHRSRRWEPEPLRWLGYEFVSRSRLRYLRQVEERGKYPEKPILAQRLWKF